MKRIITLLALILLGQSLLIAQEGKKVSENDVKQVKLKYVQDFQNKVKAAKNVQWYQLNENDYLVNYTDNDSREGMLFTPKGTETYYYVESQYYPRAIKDTVNRHFNGYKIKEVFIRKVNKTKGDISYRATISKAKGILWWRKEAKATLDFDTNGKLTSNLEEVRPQ